MRGATVKKGETGQGKMQNDIDNTVLIGCMLIIFYCSRTACKFTVLFCI